MGLNLKGTSSCLGTLRDVLTLLWSENSKSIDVFLLTWIFKTRAVLGEKNRTRIPTSQNVVVA